MKAKNWLRFPEERLSGECVTNKQFRLDSDVCSLQADLH